MKYWMILFFTIIVSSCNVKNIDTLKHEQVEFKDLPFEVSQYIKNSKDYEDDINAMLVELPKGKVSEYRLETVKTKIGPWVEYEKLICLNNNNSFRINQGVPSPYIIYENKLYIPNTYNIFTTVDDLYSISFIMYELK